MKTAAATTPDGALWIAWAAQIEGNFDIYARKFDGKRWSPIYRLTEAPERIFTTASRRIQMAICIWRGNRSAPATGISI